MPDALPDALMPDAPMPDAPDPDPLPDAPDSNALPEAPDLDALPDAPDTDALPEAPDLSALPDAPDPDALPEALDPDPLPKMPDGSPTTAVPRAPSTPRVTRVAVERPTGFGAPVRVRTSDGLLAARLVARDGTRAEVALVAGGAMLLGGDHVVVSVRVDPGCALTLTDVGGTVAYDGDGEACRWDADIRLGPGAGLTWAGLPFVVASGADVRRTTTARLATDARLTLRETVVLGRSGERGGRITLRTDVADDVGPILVEELTAAGDHPVPGVLGDHAVIDTITDVRGSPPGGPGDPGGPDSPDGRGGPGSLDRPGGPDSLDGPGWPDSRIGPGGTDSRGGPDRPAPAPDLDGAVTLRLDRGGTLTRWLGPATHLSPLGPSS